MFTIVYAMEWSNERVIKVFNLTSLSSCLWDCSLSEYKDLNKRQDAIMELMISFGVGRIEIETKIKIVSHSLHQYLMTL